MAEIPRSFLDSLTVAINRLSAATQKVVLARLNDIEYTDIADLREKVIALLEEYLPTATDNAAAYAATSYDAIREYSVGEMLGAQAVSQRKPEATRGAVKALVDIVDKGKPWEMFVTQVLDRCDFEIKRAAGESTAYNAEHDRLKPRFARVPTGNETCNFCTMLASRGFVYLSEETAGALSHYHPNCDCRIVQGYPGDTVEGYDPDELYRKWKNGGKTDRADSSVEEIEDIKRLLQGKGLDDKNIDGIALIIYRIEDKDVKGAIKKALPDVKFDSLTSSGSFYSPDTHGINLDISKTAAGFAAREDKGEYQTFFHEFGHFLDHYFNNYAMDTYDVKRGRITYRHQVMKGLSNEKELDKAIKKDVKKILNDIKKRDGCTLYEAKEKLTDEILELRKKNPEKLGGISDIIHGATSGTCCDRRKLPKHDKTYWKRKGTLAQESFAHFMECAAANTDALETLKRYLPESYNVFKQIMKGI